MAFLASNGALSDVLEKASKRALHTRNVAQQWRTALAAGSVGSGVIISMDADLRRIRVELAGYASTTGIADYAQANTPDAPADYDVAAEWGAMMSAIDGVTGWIRANFPVDGGGFLLGRTWGTDGPVDRLFTPAQTAGLRTQLDALIATVA